VARFYKMELMRLPQYLKSSFTPCRNRRCSKTWVMGAASRGVRLLCTGLSKRRYCPSRVLNRDIRIGHAILLDIVPFDPVAESRCRGYRDKTVGAQHVAGDLHVRRR